MRKYIVYMLSIIRTLSEKLFTFITLRKEAYVMNDRPYKGVYYHKSSGKWTASIKVKGKQIYLGIFNHFEDALVARKDAERRLKENG